MKKLFYILIFVGMFIHVVQAQDKRYYMNRVKENGELTIYFENVEGKKITVKNPKEKKVDNANVEVLLGDDSYWVRLKGRKAEAIYHNGQWIGEWIKKKIFIGKEEYSIVEEMDQYWTVNRGLLPVLTISIHAERGYRKMFVIDEREPDANVKVLIAFVIAFAKDKPTPYTDSRQKTW